MLNKDAILKADDLPRETVEVPEWGGEVLVQGLNSADRDEYFDSHVKFEHSSGRDKVTIANSEALLAAKCIVNEDGNRIFSDAEVKVLARKSGKAIHRIVIVAERLSGLLDTEELAKNSGTTQGEDSASD